MKKWISLLAAAVLALTLLAGCGKDTPSGKVEELEGLKGRVVYSIGQGNVPDLVFRYLLKKAGVPYRLSDEAQDGTVSLSYVSEGTEFIGGLTAGTMHYGVISEPAATVALNKVEGAERMLDIQALYKSATGDANGYPQAALVVKKSFLEAHPGYVAHFVAAVRAGATWAESAPAEALAAIKDAGSTTVPLLNTAVAKGCNLGFVNAQSCKAQLLSFYEGLNGVLDEGAPAIPAPDDAFFVGELADTVAETGVTANVYAPDGAPAICLSKLMHDGFAGANFHLIPPANIGQTVLGGTADIAVMPTNAAATLYGKKADIVMLGVTNFGSLYMVGK